MCQKMNFLYWPKFFEFNLILFFLWILYKTNVGNKNKKKFHLTHPVMMMISDRKSVFSRSRSRKKLMNRYVLLVVCKLKASENDDCGWLVCRCRQITLQFSLLVFRWICYVSHFSSLCAHVAYFVDCNINLSIRIRPIRMCFFRVFCVFEDSLPLSLLYQMKILTSKSRKFQLRLFV